MDINIIIDSFRNITKDPAIFPIYFAIALILMALMLWKFSSAMEKQVISRIEGFFKQHFAEHEKLNFIADKKSDYEYLIENIEILKKAIDVNKLNSNSAIYKYIEYELVDLKNRFIKNFNNGSSIQKAIQENSICQQKLLTMLNSAMIKQRDRKTIYTFIAFISEQISKVIKGMELLNDQSTKLSLISVYFNNLNVLISLFSLKEIDYINKEEEELKQILDEDFNMLSNNVSLSSNTPKLVDEF